jgi:outer membrane immunogenic protein
MKSLYVAAAIVGASLANSAQAEEFTGPRIEATAGWDQVDYDLSRYSIAGDSKRSGINWGFAAGYDVPLGDTFVAGLEAGMNFSNVDQGFSDGTASYLLHARRDVDLSARLGARLGGNALLYAKAGYTNFQVGADTTVDGTTTSQRTNLDGVRLGAGVELGITKAAYLKGEYRYSNYEQGVSKNEVLTGIGLRF